MVKCPNCGAEIEFDPSLQEVKCDYCYSTFKVEELNNINLETIQGAQHDNDVYSGETYKCNQCGATLMTFDETAITFCSYCGSQAIIKDKMISVNNPDFVIPFAKTKYDCMKAYKDRINGFFLAPSYLKKDAQIDKFRGIYMPYAVFNLHKNGKETNKGEICTGRVGSYIYYDKYDVTADVDVSYEGLSFDLVSKFYDNFSTSIPFNFKLAKPFDINYLHGFYADTYDVKDSHYKYVAQQIVAPDVSRRLRSNVTFRRYGVSSPKIDLKCDSKIGMFPVYFLATRDKSNKKVHYAAVNGQTGKVACDLPIDFGKYILVSLVVALAIFAIINGALVLTPTKVAVFSIIMCIINLIISKNQARKIDERANHTTDIGIVSQASKSDSVSKTLTGLNDAYGIPNKQVEELNKDSGLLGELAPLLFFWILFAMFGLYDGLSGFLIGLIGASFVMVPSCLIIIAQHNNTKKTSSDKKKNKKSVAFKYIYKEIIGIIISVLAIMSMQANDFYYYGAAFVSLLLVILSFKDLVQEHNLLTSNVLPQLNERGGNK